MEPNETKPDKNERKRLTFAKTLAISVEFGFIIVLPLLAFGYIGRWLAHKYDSKLFLIAGVAFAIAISSFWFYKRIIDIYEDLKNL